MTARTGHLGQDNRDGKPWLDRNDRTVEYMLGLRDGSKGEGSMTYSNNRAGCFPGPSDTSGQRNKPHSFSMLVPCTRT
jgi:hypothetical protein